MSGWGRKALLLLASPWCRALLWQANPHNPAMSAHTTGEGKRHPSHWSNQCKKGEAREGIPQGEEGIPQPSEKHTSHVRQLLLLPQLPVKQWPCVVYGNKACFMHCLWYNHNICFMRCVSTKCVPKHDVPICWI